MKALSFHLQSCLTTIQGRAFPFLALKKCLNQASVVLLSLIMKSEDLKDLLNKEAQCAWLCSVLLGIMCCFAKYYVLFCLVMHRWLPYSSDLNPVHVPRVGLWRSTSWKLWDIQTLKLSFIPSLHQQHKLCLISNSRL